MSDGPLKILFLAAPSMPHARRWIAQLQERGHEVRAATLHEIPPGNADHTIALRTRGDVSRPTGPKDILAAIRPLRRMIASFEPDLTIAYYMTSYGLLAALVNAPCVIGATAGGDVLVDPYDSLFQRIRNRFILAISLGHAKKVLAWAPHVAARLRELGVPEGRIFIQPRGVDLEKFKPASGRSSSRTVNILSLRQFKPLYEIPTLVRALGRLDDDNLTFSAALVGDGPEHPRIEEMVREMGLDDRVILPGTEDESGVIERLGKSDIYVSTSSTDGASAALFEAMAMGAYPIVTDIAANRTWITPGTNGDLFPVGDDDALAGAIRSAIADPVSRRRATENNLALVRDKLDFRKNMVRIETEMMATLRSRRNGWDSKGV